jgi:hypothetical protein
VLDNKTIHGTGDSNWASIKHVVPQDPLMGPTQFLLCINDLPAVTDKKALPVTFAGDTSTLFTYSKFMDLHVNIEAVLSYINSWFKNCLSLIL